MSSEIFHYEGLRYWGPMSPERVETLLDLVKLSNAERVLDLGCGRGELLLRIGERDGASVLGIDRSPAAVALAKEGAAQRVPGAEFRVAEASDFEPSAPFDLVCWLGGPYVGDSLDSTLAALRSWTKPGARLLIGHGFWQSEPPDDYVTATGIPKSEFKTHFGNIELARRHDLTLLYSAVSNRDEWDHFEGRILNNWEERLASEPANEELRAVVERKRAFNDAQQRWGREAMGFGFYLLRCG